MVWKSRENSYPKPDFLARLIAYLRMAYPGAELTEDLVRELWPFILTEWRHGKDERGVATSTCSCDGVRIVPSPGVQVALANKRIVRAPQGAQPSQVFGLASLRASSRIERLQLAMQIVQRKLQLKDEALLAAETHLQRARSEKRKRDLLQRQQELLEAKRTLGLDLERMQKEYAETVHGVERIIEPLQTPASGKKRSSGKKPAQPPAPAAAEPTPTPHEPKPAAAKAKAKAKNPEASTPEDCACQTPGAPAPDVAEQDLSGLLNTLAGSMDPRSIAGLSKAEGA